MQPNFIIYHKFECAETNAIEKKKLSKKGCDLTELVTKLLKNRQNWHLGAKRNEHWQKSTHHGNIISKIFPSLTCIYSQKTALKSYTGALNFKRVKNAVIYPYIR